MAERSLLSGWGLTAPSMALVQRAEGRQIASLIRDSTDRGVIARGLGRSYGDAAQNAGGQVLLVDNGSFIQLDASSGTVRAGAGVSLAKLLSELTPQGLFLPVIPGTGHVTVGGAIAADVHGKNHHRNGSFGQYVEEIELLDGRGELRQLSASTTPHQFWATIGGMGLTGVIISAKIRLIPVKSSRMTVLTTRAGNLDEAMRMMGDADDQYTYSVAWIDLLARGKSLGRSVLSLGEHAPAGEAREGDRMRETARVSIPKGFPRGLVNSWSVRAFNELWFRKSPRTTKVTEESISSSFIRLMRLVGGTGCTVLLVSCSTSS